MTAETLVIAWLIGLVVLFTLFAVATCWGLLR